MIGDRLKKIPYYKHKVFENQPGIFQMTTCREGGVSDPPFHSLNLGENTADRQELVKRNLQALISEIRTVVEVQQLVLAKQVHGNRVVRINEEFVNSSAQLQKKTLSDCDALMTDIPGIFIGIRTADCVPLTIFNAAEETIAVVHAGWRGIVNGIIPKALEMMQVDQNPDSFFCGIGPCIEGDVYQVGKEVIDAVAKVVSDDDVWFKKDVHYYLDLKKAACRLLIDTGIPEANIEISPFCTFKNSDVFYSYRKAGGNTGRFLSGMMLNKKK